VSGGHATFKTTSLPVGTASLTAVFAPTNSADYIASTSAPITLDVVAAPVISSVTSGGKTVASGETLAPGQTLTVSATGFQPDESVEVDVHSVTINLTTVHADATGKVTATVTLPKTLAAGSHTLTLTGSVGSVSFAFMVTGSTGILAETGTDVIGGTLLGGVLAAAGLFLLLAGRTRRRGMHRAR
jgi:hypothetical protein